MTRTQSAIIQSTLDFAIREINALEQRIVTAEDDADSMLWEQAAQVVAQLEAGLTHRALAAQWLNRDGEPYSHRHVGYTSQVFGKHASQVPRPRFRDAYNEIAHAKMAVHHSSESPEHFTPGPIIEAAIKVLGKIDLDPCSNSADTPNVPALNHYTITDDGLQQRWSGTVYMNPPYGRTIQQWIEKLTAEHQAGHVTAAIALVPARPDTEWWRLLRDHCCCFIAGRLVFGGNEDPAPFPSAVYYLGPKRRQFQKTFSKLGDIWERVAP